MACGVMNSNYAVYHSGGDIYSSVLARPNDWSRRISACTSRSVRSRLTPILALSQRRTSSLAVSAVTEVSIHDLGNGTLLCTLPGIGRVVTSLSWSRGFPEILAAGHVDGQISIWNTRNANSPLSRLNGTKPSCQSIGFCTTDPWKLASTHGGDILVWDLQNSSLRPVNIISEAMTMFKTLDWQPGWQAHLLATTAGGELRLFDLLDILSETKHPGTILDDSESDDGVFGEPDGLKGRYQLLGSMPTDASLDDVHWIGQGCVHRTGQWWKGGHPL